MRYLLSLQADNDLLYFGTHTGGWGLSQSYGRLEVEAPQGWRWLDVLYPVVGLGFLIGVN